MQKFGYTFRKTIKTYNFSIDKIPLIPLGPDGPLIPSFPICPYSPCAPKNKRTILFSLVA